MNKIVLVLGLLMLARCGMTIQTAAAKAFSYRDDYPANSVVGIVIQGDPRFTEQLDRFAEGVVKKLIAFSEENRDFRVVTPNSEGSLPDSTTHVIRFLIDSVHLVDYEEYKSTRLTIDSVAGAVGNVAKWFSIAGTGVGGLNFVSGDAMGAQYAALASRWAITHSDKPSMVVSAQLLSVADKGVVWNYRRELKSISSVPVPEVDQIGELLGSFRNQLENQLPYFKLKS